MEEQARRVLAAAIVEALETGNPIAPLVPELRPPDAAAGETVAEEVLDALGLHPCGIRLAPGPQGAMLAGPMLDSRLLAQGAAVALGALRHPSVTAAAIGVLAEPLLDGPARFAAVLPALDIAASRFRDGPGQDGVAAADLAGLGFVVAGRRATWDGAAVGAALARGKARPREVPVDLAARFAEAAARARDLGGLPAGGLLVVAGLTPAMVPVADEAWSARFAELGSARATFVATPEPAPQASAAP
jgi:2-keto-4-pentenoate hydratase